MSPERRPMHRTIWFWLAIGSFLSITGVQLFRANRIDAGPPPPPVLGPLPQWTLTAADGQPFGSDDLSGDVYVTSFFFTSCVTICPALQQAMKRLQDGYEQAGAPIKLVSMTVDPENDTPEVLTQYANGLEADLDRWTFITGPEQEVRGLIVDGFRTWMGQKEEIEDRPGVFDVGHGGRLVVVDGDGNVRAHYEVLERSDDARTWTVKDEALTEVLHRSIQVFRAGVVAEEGGPFGCSAAWR